MYRIDKLDNGYLLVNITGLGMGFGSVYFPTIEKLTEHLLGISRPEIKTESGAIVTLGNGNLKTDPA